MDNEVLHDLSDFNVRLEFLKGLKSSSTLLRLNTAGISMRPLIEEQSTVGSGGLLREDPTTFLRLPRHSVVETVPVSLAGSPNCVFRSFLLPKIFQKHTLIFLRRPASGDGLHF